MKDIYDDDNEYHISLICVLYSLCYKIPTPLNVFLSPF